MASGFVPGPNNVTCVVRSLTKAASNLRMLADDLMEI